MKLKRFMPLVLGVISLATAAWLVFTLFSNFSHTPKQNAVGIEEELPGRAINGVKTSLEIAEMRPVAVIIENHPDSRPQSGLSDADIVYEALAEGGITRFLSIFQTHLPESIGPVRSAREYFAEIANEWGSVFSHVGGSNEVIGQIKNDYYKNISDVNEYYNEQFFERIKTRGAPHNVYTSSELLHAAIQEHGFSKTTNFEPWQFKDDSLIATATAAHIAIDFSRAGYEVGWEYSSATNEYKRLIYFQPHIDKAANKQISAKTIVVQIVEVTPVPNDPLLSVDIDLDFGGRAVVFMDGMAVEATWKKQAGRTRFYDSAGLEIKFNRGPVWVELLPKEKANGLVWQ